MKILEVNVDLVIGGILSLVKNIILHKQDEDTIDIARYEPMEHDESRAMITSHGGKVFFVGNKRGKAAKVLGCIPKLRKILNEGNYDVVHIHADVANKHLLMGLAAKLCHGKPKIILHSHASDVDGNHRIVKGFIHRVCRRWLKYIGTDFVACSDLAAQWMFPNIKSDRIKMLNNGIDLSKYRFSPSARDEERRRLGMEERFIIGHVGRFVYQKNHTYLLRLFAAYRQHDPSALLLLIGEGELEKETRRQAADMGIGKDVVFYGTSDNVAAQMQAMDIFVLPSNFEGLPIVGVEAQAAALPVLFSTEISRQARLTEHCAFVPITDDALTMWAEEISKTKGIERIDTYDRMRECGFSIENTVSTLWKIYGKQ